LGKNTPCRCVLRFVFSILALILHRLLPCGAPAWCLRCPGLGASLVPPCVCLRPRRRSPAAQPAARSATDRGRCPVARFFWWPPPSATCPVSFFLFFWLGASWMPHSSGSRRLVPIPMRRSGLSRRPTLPGARKNFDGMFHFLVDIQIK
jgi:hypothetical protein